jgi:hypothetical protein
MTAPGQSVAEISEQLLDANRRVHRLQEEADYSGMFQQINQHWKARYLSALRSLAKARTDQHELALRLDIAERHEAALLELELEKTGTIA